LTETILALPIWPELEMKEIEYICEQINKVGPSMRSAYSGQANQGKKESLCRQKVI
jgi:hypothetical protein